MPPELTTRDSRFVPARSERTGTRALPRRAETVASGTPPERPAAVCTVTLALRGSRPETRQRTATVPFRNALRFVPRGVTRVAASVPTGGTRCASTDEDEPLTIRQT